MLVVTNYLDYIASTSFGQCSQKSNVATQTFVFRLLSLFAVFVYVVLTIRGLAQNKLKHIFNTILDEFTI